MVHVLERRGLSGLTVTALRDAQQALRDAQQAQRYAEQTEALRVRAATESPEAQWAAMQVVLSTWPYSQRIARLEAMGPDVMRATQAEFAIIGQRLHHYERLLDRQQAAGVAG